MVSADDPVRAYDAIIDKIFEEVKPRINYNDKKASAHEYNPRNIDTLHGTLRAARTRAVLA